jgi:hypothetical protein
MLSSYDQAVGQLIVKSRIAAGLPPLDNYELALHISAWAEIVFGVIPESRLQDAYVRAMRDNADGFTLTAPGLVKGYRDLCESERLAPQMPMDRNLLPGNVCSRCFGTGLEQFIEADGYKSSRRCEH